MYVRQCGRPVVLTLVNAKTMLRSAGCSGTSTGASLLFSELKKKRGMFKPRENGRFFSLEKAFLTASITGITASESDGFHMKLTASGGLYWVMLVDQYLLLVRLFCCS